MSQIHRVNQILEKQLRKGTFSLTSSYVKEFQNRKGFIPFALSDGSLKGCALVDTTIEPPVRIVSYKEQEFNQQYIKNSIREAIDYRHQQSKLGLLDISSTAAYRLINEGGDGLPGLTIDVYSDFIQITTHSEYYCNHLNFISELVMNDLGKRGSYWRAKFKHKQAFSKHYQGDKHTYDTQGLSDLVVVENGMKVVVDLADVISTGLFMDQRANRQYLGGLFQSRPQGSILNTFAHTCTFSLSPSIHCNGIGTFNIDTSQKYLDIAKKNFQLNGIDINKHRFVRQDVFSRLEDRGKTMKYDVIVLDPPSLARGPKFGVFSTKNRYRDLLDLAIPCLKKGGIILAFVNTRALKEESWLRQLGIHDHLAENNNNSNNNGNNNMEEDEISPDEQEQLKEMQEMKELNIGEAQFSSITKSNRHSNVLPFIKLKKFKKLQSLEQDIDYRVRAGDERVGKHLKGIVLKHKVDYTQFSNQSKKK